MWHNLVYQPNSAEFKGTNDGQVVTGHFHQFHFGAANVNTLDFAAVIKSVQCTSWRERGVGFVGFLIPSFGGFIGGALKVFANDKQSPQHRTPIIEVAANDAWLLQPQVGKFL